MIGNRNLNNTILEISTTWIQCEVVTCVFTLASMGLCFTMLLHVIKTKAFIEKRRSIISLYDQSTINHHENRTSLYSITSQVCQGPSHSPNMRGRFAHVKTMRISNNYVHLNKLVLAANISILLRIISEHLHLFLSLYEDDIYCNIIIRIQILLYAASVACLYSFLWLRQRILYLNPAMKLLSTPTTRVASWLVLILMICAEIITIVIFMWNSSVEGTEAGCTPLTPKIPDIYGWMLILIFTIIFQGVLLALFLHPLVKQKNHMTGVQIKTTSTNSTCCYWKVAKRVAIAATLCILSDIVAILVTLATKRAIILSNLIFDFNLLVNLVCITCSFKDWKKRIFPCL